MFPQVSFRSRRRFLMGAAGFLGASLLACRGDDAKPALATRQYRGEPRPFYMGLSSVPVDPSEQGYEEAFRLAAEVGEVVMVQRTPPWPDFLPGGRISSRTENLTRLEKRLAQRYNLRHFLAIDMTQPADRGRLAGVPSDLEDADFSNRDVRDGLINYAKYLALNYQPAYLAFGVEVDLNYWARGDAPFRTFQSLYFQAYDEVKSVSEDTLVFPTFQYENLRTTNGWSLVHRFEPKLDLLAVSSYPSSLYPTLEDLPADYFRPLAGRVDKPVAIASTGWSSVPPVGSTQTREPEQAEYLTHLLSEAEVLSAELVVWYLGRDLLLAPSDGFETLTGMGLVSHEGRQKSAYLAWQAYAERPHPGVVP